MGVTLSTFMRKPVTREYPDYHKPLPERDRAFPVLLWDAEEKEPFCTGCHACERACPHDALKRVNMQNLPALARWLQH